MAKLTEEFLFNIYMIVEEIPVGKVATYGQIAKLSGYEKNARLVGKALNISSYYGKYPCHRVVNSKGELAKNFHEQEELLKSEKVLLEKGKVNLKKYTWEA
jgi:O-6-methylguanine DNA methyltransferase